jgi:hypothetical protein
MALRDTSPEIEAMQSQIHHSMTGERRLLVALEISYYSHELMKSGIRNDHPDWSEDQVIQEFRRRLFAPRPVPDGA